MKNLSRTITIFLVLFLLVGTIGSSSVEAGFLGDHKGSLITVVKGLVMLWILNLMRNNTTGGEDILTSTIKKGLNLDLSGNKKTQVPDDKTNSDQPADSSSVTQDNTQSTNIETNNQSDTNSMEQIVKIADLEQRMVELINQKRREKGLIDLKPDMELVKLARKKAEDMINNNYFAHQSPTFGSPFDMLKDAGIEYSLAGENLAGANTVNQAFQSLMNSQEHKDNILQPRYDRVGIGIITGGPYGLMIVQLFVDSPDPAV